MILYDMGKIIQEKFIMSKMKPETYFVEKFKGKPIEEQQLEIDKLKELINELEETCKLPIKPPPKLELNLHKMYLE